MHPTISTRSSNGSSINVFTRQKLTEGAPRWRNQIAPQNQLENYADTTLQKFLSGHEN